MLANLKASFAEIRGHGRRGELQFRCFVLTFMAHGCTFFLRKALAVIKHDLSEDLQISLPLLGWLDTAMLLPMAVVQIFFVNLLSELGPRKIVGGSLILSSLSLATLGFWDNYASYALLLFVGGACQALVFPYCITALSAWYPGRGRSTVFGTWGICVFLGGILGTMISVEARILLGWEYVFLTASGIVIALGVPLIRLLRMPSGTTQMPLQHVAPQVTGDPSASGSPRTEVLFRAEPFSQSERSMTDEEEQATVSSGVYVVDSVPKPRRLGVVEVPWHFQRRHLTACRWHESTW